MSTAVALAIGALAGFAIATLLIQPGNCCQRIGQAASDRIGEELGPKWQAAFDALGGKKWVPGVLNTAGV